jgi:hypothetical protein
MLYSHKDVYLQISRGRGVRPSEALKLEAWRKVVCVNASVLGRERILLTYHRNQDVCFLQV